MSVIFLELPSSIYWASLTIYVQFNFFWLHQLLLGTWLVIQQRKPDHIEGLFQYEQILFQDIMDHLFIREIGSIDDLFDQFDRFHVVAGQ